MMTISIKDFDNQEVCIWLNAIGLGTKIGPFIQNAVDGDLLCSLGLDDLTGDLGLSGLQAKKVLRFIDAEMSASGAQGDANLDNAISELEQENAKLLSQVNNLRADIAASQGSQIPSPAPVYVPAPEPVRHHSPSPPQKHHHSPPPPQHRGPGVIGGAARGAAGGAIKGAIAGAILPGMSAGDGAAAGAAVGATTGGLRGARNRLRR